MRRDSRKPTSYRNLVVVSFDTLRSDLVPQNPCKLWQEKYDLPARDIPALRALAAEGAFYWNCIAAAPYTSASHATFFTGKWPPRHGVYELFNRALRGKSIFSIARAHGMRTVFKTDFPMVLGRDLGFTRDVDLSIAEDDDAVLSAVDATVPTLYFIHFGGLHIPYGYHNKKFGGEEYAAKVAQLERDLPKLGTPVDRVVESRRDARDTDLLLRYKAIVQHFYAAGQYQAIFELYLDGAQHFFANRLSPFLDALRSRLPDSETLYAFFGDHGEEYDADSYGHHNSVAEGVLRVPLILRGPGITPNIIGSRVRAVDFAPTLCELMGWRRGKPRFDGSSVADADDVRLTPHVAYAQAYTAETADLVRFQSRLLANGRKTGQLRHVRYKEAVYRDDLKLSVQNFRYVNCGGLWGLRRISPITKLERITSEGRITAVRDRAAERDMEALMVDYNDSNTFAKRGKV